MRRSELRLGAGLAALFLAGTVRAASLLTNANATAGSYYDDRFWPSVMLDGNAGSFWMTPPTAEDFKFFYFNLNGLYTLDHIETYNGSTDWNRQLSSALIEYSVDGVSWTTLGGARQSFKTRDLGWDTFSFGGAQARLIRFGSYTNLGGGELWSSFGEVKIYGDEIPQSLQRIDGTSITVTASSSYPGRDAARTTDGSGLIADADGDGIPIHDRNPANMWSSTAQSNVTNQWLRFEFAAPVSLDHMLVWNWNVPDSGGYDWCLRNARIRYSLNGTDWDTLVESAAFTQGPGTGWNHTPSQEYYEAADQFGFGGRQVKYVMLDLLHNFKPGNDAHVGVSEVWFYAPLSGPAPEGTVVVVH